MFGRLQKRKFRKKFRSLYTLRQECNLQNLYYYHKGNIIQAPLEAVLSFYCVVTLTLFTDFFLEKIPKPGEVIRLVLLPSAISTIVCLIYTVFVILFVNNRLSRLFWSIEKKIQFHGYKQVCMKFNNKMQRTALIFHIIGFLCYSMLSLLMAILSNSYFIENCYYESDKEQSFILTTWFLGSLFGASWNLLGYWGDMRVDWSKFIKRLPPFSPTTKKAWNKSKYHYFSKHSSINVGMVVAILVSLCIFVSKFHSDFKASTDIEIYYLFFSLFITLLALYIRMIFKHFYLRRSDDDSLNIFIGAEDIEPD